MTPAPAPTGSRASSLGGRIAAALVLRAMLAASAFCVAAPSAAAGQSTSMTVMSALNFGVLLPGVSASVPPSDVARRSEVWIDGTSNIDLRLVLPTEMVSSAGDRFPLRFVAGDGATASQKAPTLVLFDPNATVRINLKSHNGTVRVYVGGTALPPAAQLPGTYTATMSVVVTRVNQ